MIGKGLTAPSNSAKDQQPLAALARGLLLVVVMALAWLPAGAQTLSGNLRGDVPTLDPVGFSGAVGYRVLALAYEGLTAFDSQGRLIPALATRWETPDEGRTWRFYLRPDVRFHTGRVMTATDVKRTFQAVLTAPRPGLSPPFLDKLAGRAAFVDGRDTDLAGVEIIDPLTFDLRFTEPVATFPFYPFFIFDVAAVRAWGPGWFEKYSAGTGPFRIDGWRRGGDVRLTVNADYWGDVPALDGLTLRAVPSGDTALAMFDSGELDFVTVTEPAHRLLAVNPGKRQSLQAVPRLQARYIGMNADRYPPFADPRVRRAVSLAIDRQAIIDGIYGGLATLPRGFGSASLVSGAMASPVADRYDPGEAQRLLAEAGYPGGRGLAPLELSTLDIFRPEGAYAVQQLTSVLGMQVRLRVLDRAALTSAGLSRALPLFIAGWSADFPEPLTYLDALWYSHSPFNQTGWHDADFDVLIDRARRTVPSEARLMLYQQAEHHLAETMAGAMLPTPMNLLLRHDSARMVTITPFGFLSFAARGRKTGP